MDDQATAEGRIIRDFVSHPGWKLLEQWLDDQGSSDRLQGLKDWDQYLRVSAQVDFARAFKGRVEEYLHNLNEQN